MKSNPWWQHRAWLVYATAALLVALAMLWYRRAGGGCGGGPASRTRELVIFHAGSLSVPFRELALAFEKKNPGVKVKAEAAGSRRCARKISDLGRRADVMASADYKVVENLLMPEHASYNIRFATNEMAIAYTARSMRARDAEKGAWHRILLDPEVRFGRSDPNSDPCGYRTLMVFQLAEIHYGVPGLAKRLEARHGRKFIRPKETDLLALLEAGEIDYLFIYRSVAVQHGLRTVLLPPEINLGSPRFAKGYRRAKVTVTGKTPGTFITRTGEPMVYSVTIPRSARHRPLAEAFVAFLLSEEGRKIVEKNGQPFLRPVVVDGEENLPAVLRKAVARVR